MLEDNANQKLHVKERLWRQPLWAISKCLLTLSMLHRHTVFLLATIELKCLCNYFHGCEKRKDITIATVCVECQTTQTSMQISIIAMNFHCHCLKKEKWIFKKKKLIMINLLLPTHQRLCDLHCCEFFDVIVPKKKNYNY